MKDQIHYDQYKVLYFSHNFTFIFNTISHNFAFVVALNSAKTSSSLFKTAIEFVDNIENNFSYFQYIVF